MLFTDRSSDNASPTLVLERTVGEGKIERRYSDGTRIVSFRNGTEKELAPDGTSIVRFVNGDIKQACEPCTAVPFLAVTLSRSVPILSRIALGTLDLVQTFPTTGMVVYYYAEAKTTHTTAADGTETFEFPSGQVCACQRADGCSRRRACHPVLVLVSPSALTLDCDRLLPGPQHETHYADGSKKIVFPDGTFKVSFPNGQHRSVFPDGTTMIEFPDGTRVRPSPCCAW